MNKEFSLVNSKELVDLEKEIDSLDDIKEWSNKIKKMKELNEKIVFQKQKITNFIEMVSSGEVKKSKKKKDNMSLDDLLKEYNKTDEMEEKIRLFNLIQSLIKESELELFDE